MASQRSQRLIIFFKLQLINDMEITPRQTAESMPVGFRFQPTDEELVGHYLKHKLEGDNSTVQIIPEVDVCKQEPWDLPAFSVVKSKDPEWFFFSPRDLKYSNSNRCNRATKAGFWKATGKDRNIKVRGTKNVIIGTKKSLVFYKGRVPHGVKTNWIIHEYNAVTFPPDKRSYVLCRLMKKAEKKAEKRTNALVNNEENPSDHMASNYEKQDSVKNIPDIYASPEVNMESIFEATSWEHEHDLRSLQQSPILTEHRPSPYLANVSLCNHISHFQLPSDTAEEKDYVNEFLNSILVDEIVHVGEESRRDFARLKIDSPGENKAAIDNL